MTTGQFIYNITKIDMRMLVGLAPGNGGDETPIRARNGIYYLYVYDFIFNTHYYIDEYGNKKGLPME